MESTRRMPHAMACAAMMLAVGLTGCPGPETGSSGSSSSGSSSGSGSSSSSGVGGAGGDAGAASSSGVGGAGGNVGSSSSGTGGAGGNVGSVSSSGAGGAGGDAGSASSSSGSGGAGGGGGSGGGGSFKCDIPRVDLLLAVDNSRGMGEKQELLARAIPDLIQGLVNPVCVDPNGVLPPSQPASPSDPCAPGTIRAFTPQTDIHIGVVSSSIGGHGSDSCPNTANVSQCGANPNTTNNDKGRLIYRTDGCNTGSIPTYANKGFLAWDPQQVLMPPGEGTLDNGMGGGLVPTLKDMIQGAGEIGCGFESQLESVYRFLVDPAPYQTISVVNNNATPSGTDNVVLTQRAAFLRPDSLLAILMLTEENDCSTKEYGQFYYVNQIQNGGQAVRLPRARQECATNPNDPCCKSCGQAAGNCPVDSTCVGPGGGLAFLTVEEDSINQRCFDQKRRFGIDFLYPIDRYTQAFTSATIADKSGNLVPNPIFSDLDPNDPISTIRDPSQVLFAGIVGVPWQDIARDPMDPKKGFKAWDELQKPVAGAPSAWDIIIGDPANYVNPLDPLMIPSIKPRKGTNPITGDALASSAMPLGNPINGNEYTNQNDDLQYACIFALPTDLQRDCTDPNVISCECANGQNDIPLCKADPNNNNLKTLQVRGKAYPGIRQLALAKSLGQQAAVGSVCAPQTSAPAAEDYGYRQSVNIVTDWLTRRNCDGM